MTQLVAVEAVRAVLMPRSLPGRCGVRAHRDRSATLRYPGASLVPCASPVRSGPPAPGTNYIPQRAPRLAASTAPRYWPSCGRRQWGAGILAGAGRAEALLAAGAGEGRGEDRATPDGMGSCESSQGRRKVSFEVDEQDRVRVLQGIRVRRPGGAVEPAVEGCGGRGGGSRAGEGSGRELRGARCRERGWKGWVGESNEEGRETWKAEGVGGWRSGGLSGRKESWGPGHGCLPRTPAPALYLHFQTLLSTLFSLVNDFVLSLPCALRAV